MSVEEEHSYSMRDVNISDVNENVVPPGPGAHCQDNYLVDLSADGVEKREPEGQCWGSDPF